MKDVIFKSQNGSKLYGLDHPLSDDDYFGIFVEDPELLFMGGKELTRSLRETPDGVRNGPGDIDGQASSVRHFFAKAADGNPSMVCIFFAPESAIVENTLWGQTILDSKDLFISRKLAAPFKGYMKAQLQRLKGEKRGHQPNRPELIEQFGYDVKYAQQVARLAFQGIEILDTGRITLPMKEREKNICMDIRNGKYSYSEALKLLDELEQELLKSAEKSSLPEEPDKSGIAKLSQDIHENYWSSK